MKLVVVAATEMELNEARLKYRHTNIIFTTCGIGMMQCAAAISKLCLVHQPGFVIQSGIAGSFGNISLGTTVAIKEELLADTGVLENNIWKDIFDLGLLQKDNPPFQNKKSSLIRTLLHITCCNYLVLPA